MPFPSTTVIHPDWSAHHQPTAQGAMTGGCIITTPGTGAGTRDPDTGYTTPAGPTTVYDGVCRVQGDFRPTPVVDTDQQTANRRYLVAIPAATTGVEEQMTVKVTSAPHAPQLAGRTLTIQALEYATEEFELDLICVEAEFQGDVDGG